MRNRYLKVIGSILLLAAIICTVTYAQEQMKKCKLPAAAQEAVKEMYPNKEMQKVEAEELSITVYEVDFTDGGSMLVSADGVVVSIETVEDLQSVPAAVAKTITDSAKDATVKIIEKDVAYAAVMLVGLEKTKDIYEAKIDKDGQEIEVKIDPSGNVISVEKQNDDEDEDVEVSIDQVPTEVKATLLKEANGNEIEKIEMEIENELTIYEAEVIIDGQEIEIKVAADGTLISKKIEDDDDDADDDEDDDEEEDDD